jgi:hypothetical protein
MAKFEKMLANIAEYNSNNHRHIFYVSYIGYGVCDFTVKISGTAGTMRYGGYTWRECIRRYNAMAKEEKSKRAALYGY